MCLHNKKNHMRLFLVFFRYGKLQNLSKMRKSIFECTFGNDHSVRMVIIANLSYLVSVRILSVSSISHLFHAIKR